MSLSSPTPSALTPASLLRWGRVVLGGGFGASLVLVLYLAWAAPEVLPFVPVALFGAVAVWYLFRHPLLNLCAVLGGFVLVAGYSEGFQVQEVLYGLYYFAFLGHWFFTRLYLRRERLFVTGTDRAVLLFLLWAMASLGLTVLFGGSLRTGVSEWIALSMLALYFPVRDACVRYRYGPMIIFGVFCWLGLFFTLRNLSGFLQTVDAAVYAWQIARGRVVSNETFLLIPSVLSLVVLLYVRTWGQRLVVLAALSLFFSALVLSQSRAFWVDFALVAALLFVLVDWGRKKALIGLGVAGGVGLVAVLFLFFGEFITLMAFGLVERLLSIGTAASRDISLINRFYEAQAVWDLVKQNPILGYGLGTPYQVYDIIDNATFEKAYCHNGYLGVWYRMGLLGLVPLLYVWGVSAWRGLQLFLQKSAPLEARAGRRSRRR